MNGDIISVRCNAKYKSTVIYKIYCKDETVYDVYIGQTTNFERRKFFHSRDSLTSNLKLYECIRSHGGWDNWDMSVLHEYTCKNYIHSSKIEWFWWNALKPTLNSVIPGNKYIKKDKKRMKDFETYISDVEFTCRKPQHLVTA